MTKEVLSRRFHPSQDKKPKVSAPKNKKMRGPGESENQRPKRRKEKLIRLDDLIPKQDVKGGHQLLFGTTDTAETTNNNRRE
jgi:hypothetical protein